MSNPERSGPYCSINLSVNKYPETLSRYYGVSPEEVKWGQKVKSPGAMEMVEVVDVCERIEQFLANKIG